MELSLPSLQTHYESVTCRFGVDGIWHLSKPLRFIAATAFTWFCCCCCIQLLTGVVMTQLNKPDFMCTTWLLQWWQLALGCIDKDHCVSCVLLLSVFCCHCLHVCIFLFPKTVNTSLSCFSSLFCKENSFLKLLCSREALFSWQCWLTDRRLDVAVICHVFTSHRWSNKNHLTGCCGNQCHTHLLILFFSLPIKCQMSAQTLCTCVSRSGEVVCLCYLLALDVSYIKGLTHLFLSLFLAMSNIHPLSFLSCGLEVQNNCWCAVFSTYLLPSLSLLSIAVQVLLSEAKGSRPCLVPHWGPFV